MPGAPLSLEKYMTDTDNFNSNISELLKTIHAWVDTDVGKQHNQFLISLIVTLQHSGGAIPELEVKEGKGLVVLWDKGAKKYGILLHINGGIINICKEEDGRMFASTQLNK